MSFSLIITTRQYVGNPIDCVHTKDIPEDVLNTYCWIQSTYTLRSLFLKKQGISVPYPGIGNSDGDPSDKKHYKYYQWVCFCLFFQVSLWERDLNMLWNVPHTATKSPAKSVGKQVFMCKSTNKLIIVIDYQKASLNSKKGSSFVLIKTKYSIVFHDVKQMFRVNKKYSTLFSLWITDFLRTELKYLCTYLLFGEMAWTCQNN